MINTRAYISVPNAKEALAYYESVLGATKIKRVALNPKLAEEMGIKVDNFEDSTVDGSFELLGETISITDEMNFPKQHSIILCFEKSDWAEVLDFYHRILDESSIEVVYKLQADPFGMQIFQFVDKYEMMWMFAEEDRKAERVY